MEWLERRDHTFRAKKRFVSVPGWALDSSQTAKEPLHPPGYSLYNHFTLERVSSFLFLGLHLASYTTPWRLYRLHQKVTRKNKKSEPSHGVAGVQQILRNFWALSCHERKLAQHVTTINIIHHSRRLCFARRRSFVQHPGPNLLVLHHLWPPLKNKALKS